MAKNNNENTTVEGLTEEDLAAIAASFAEGDVPALTHTVLEIWENLLSNIEEARKERVTPVVANRIITNYPKLEFSDIPAYWNEYYDLMTEMRTILRTVIASKEDCFKHIEDDATENRELYLELLFQWSDQIARWEETWDCMDPKAALKLAAIADVAAVFMGQTGITEALSQPQVGFSFDDDARVALAKRLEEAAEERKDG